MAWKFGVEKKSCPGTLNSLSTFHVREGIIQKLSFKVPVETYNTAAPTAAIISDIKID
jgi:hypothetical protein